MREYGGRNARKCSEAIDRSTRVELLLPSTAEDIPEDEAKIGMVLSIASAVSTNGLYLETIGRLLTFVLVAGSGFGACHQDIDSNNMAGGK